MDCKIFKSNGVWIVNINNVKKKIETMKHKKAFAIMSILIFLFCIASVNANDGNDTITTSDENSEVIEESDGDILTSTDEDDGTFTSLQKKIDKANKSSTITLDRDYTYDEGFPTTGIIIAKDLTINGNGHTLNGAGKSRILLVMFGLKGQNKVVLNNIKFVNGNTNLYGGAIFNYGDLTVNKCTFTNNYAACCGGAIASVGHATYKNSVFNKNTAKGDGGAIITLSIDKIDFYPTFYYSKTATGSMDFIMDIYNDLTIKFAKEQVSGCTFTNNVAKGRGGGAIYAFGHIAINSCTFNSNKAGEKGGAVFANKDLTITNSKFTNNNAPMYGGAVYFKCHDTTGKYVNKKWVSQTRFYTGSIQSSTFTKNSASKGGAVYGFKHPSSNKCVKVSKCTFEANKATTGRDVYGGTTSNCEFKYSKLTLNSITVKKSAKNLVLTATLKKGSTPIKNAVITFKFNGKVYKVKTNNKGIAQVTLNKKVLNSLKIGNKVTYQAVCGSLYVKKTAVVKR